MPTPCYQQLVYGPSPEVEPLNYTLNAVIPLTGKYRLNTNIVYGDDENNLLYHEHTLDVEAIIYNETHTGPVNDVEKEIARLRAILSTPGLKLKLYPLGLGEIGIINVQSMDVKGGPYPQNVSVEGIASNNAILIQWSVMFRTIPCASNAILSDLLQYNVEQDMNVDEEGNMEFTFNITYQSANPITRPNELKDISELLVRTVNKSFQGMHKKKRTSLSRDQRIMSIRIVYKEIESDSAFFPYTSNISVQDELESSLLGSSVYSGKGFYSWRRVLSGQIRLPPRIHKAYAWYVFLQIVRDRFRGLRLVGKLAAVLDVEPPSSQPNVEEVAETNWYLPLRIKITNPIYTREIKFEVVYVVVTSLDFLIDATRIFRRVPNQLGAQPEDDPDEIPVSKQWYDWQLTRNTDITGRFLYETNGTPIEYDQCQETYSSHTLTPTAVLPNEREANSNSADEQDDRDSLAPLGLGNLNSDDTNAQQIDPRYTWIKYDNDFEILEDTNVVPISYLEEPPLSYYQSTDGEYASRNVYGMSLNGRITGSLQDNPSIASPRGHSVFYVRMYGHAIRYNYKIPIPFIVSVGGKSAIRVECRSSQKQISIGDIPIYLAKWDIVYMVTGGDIYDGDILSQIVSTGAPGHYH